MEGENDMQKPNYCPNCGAKLTEGAGYCSNCGARIDVQQPTPVQQIAPEVIARLEWEKTEKIRQENKRAKGGLIAIAVILGLFILAPPMAGRSGSTKKTTTPAAATRAATTQKAQSKAETTTAAETLEDEPAAEGKLGDFYVKLTGVELMENAWGEKCIAIRYDFTNNSDEPRAAIYAVDVRGFQNGQELTKTYAYAEDEHREEHENQDREILPGVTISCIALYEITDTETPIYVEATQWISLSNKTISATFEIEKGAEDGK